MKFKFNLFPKFLKWIIAIVLPLVFLSTLCSCVDNEQKPDSDSREEVTQSDNIDIKAPAGTWSLTAGSSRASITIDASSQAVISEAQSLKSGVTKVSYNVEVVTRTGFNEMLGSICLNCKFIQADNPSVVRYFVYTENNDYFYETTSSFSLNNDDLAAISNGYKWVRTK